MIVRTIEILLEYMATILCLHKVGRKKFSISTMAVAIFIIDLVIMLLIDKEIVNFYCKLIVLGFLLLYSRVKIANSWKKSIGIYILVMLIMMVLQYFVFLVFSIIQLPIQSMKLRGLIINFVVFIILALWKESYYRIIYSRLRN